MTKVYFPRLFVPIAAACVFLVDVVISLGMYAVILLYYHDHAELDDRLLAATGLADAHCHSGCRHHDLGADCLLSRLQAYRSVHDPDPHVCHAGDLFPRM